MSKSPHSSALRILPEESPLKGSGPFLESMKWPPGDSADQPRALRGLARIVDGGLCHRCGSCVGICPTGVLSRDQHDFPKVENLSACTDCDLCIKVCPGDELNYEGIHQEMLGVAGELTETHGHFSRALLAHSNDSALRESSTSGGLVTAILVELLRKGEIDGAVVITADEEKIWKGKPILARTESELLAATKSKYAISPTNVIFHDILATPGRYALVGLPCQIHGFHKAAALDPRIKERVVLTIGLFCHAAIDHQAFEIIWESLGDYNKGAKRFISRIGKHPGAPHIELEDGTMRPVYFPEKKGYRPTSMEMINVLYRLYTPERCLTCFDALSDLADISVGDPWMAPPDDSIDFKEGWSFALVRSERGQSYLQKIEEAHAITTHDLTSREALNCNRHMAEEKRWRAFRIIETHRRQGKPIPAYGDVTRTLPRHSGLQFIQTEINMLTHALCFMPRLRAPVLRFFLGSGGYLVLWLNNKRRRFKVWLRDHRESLRRKLKGRG